MEHLATLRQLYESGFLDHEEYQLRRCQLIDQITNTVAPPSVAPTNHGIAPLHVDDVYKKGKQIVDEMDDIGEEEEEVMQLELERKGFWKERESRDHIDAHFFHNQEPKEYPITLQQKYDLSQAIGMLSSTRLRQVLAFVQKVAPSQLQQVGEEYTFDLKTLSDETLRVLIQFVADIESNNGEPPLLKPCEDLVASVITENVVGCEKALRKRARPVHNSTLGESITPFVLQQQINRPLSVSPAAIHTYNHAPFSKKEEETTALDNSPMIGSDDEEELVPKKRRRTLSMTKSKGLSEGESEMDTKTEADPKGTPITIQVVIYSLAKQKNGGPRPYSCGNCGKTFKDRSNLVQHIRVHTKERPYVCDQCGKTFNHTATLREHHNIHEGVKPFVCDHPGCDMSFAQSANLRRHQRTHNGEKPFVCEVKSCGKSFAQNANLKTHMKRVHHSLSLEGMRIHN